MKIEKKWLTLWENSKDMRFFLLIVIILIGCFTIFGESSVTAEELRQMCSEAMKKRDFPKTLSLAKDLRERSIKSKDERMLGNADFYLGSSELFLGDTESGIYHLNEARSIAEKYDNDTLLGRALNSLGIYEASVNSNYYLAQHYLLQSLDCYDMEGSASANLANIALLQNDTSGVHFAMRTYEYGNKTNEIHYTYSGLINLAEFAILKGEYNAASDYLIRAEKIGEDHGYADRDRLKLLNAIILAHFGNTEESNDILKNIKADITEKLPIYLPDLLYQMGYNYYKQRKYAESNAILMEAEQASKNNASSTSLGKIYSMMAANYSAMGLDSQAYTYMNQAFDIAEKNGQTDRQRMMNERKLTLDAIHQDQKRQLAEENARYTRRLSIFLSLLLLLAIATIIIVIFNLRRRNKLYRHIVQQNVAMLEEEEKYKGRLLELESQLESQAENEIVDTHSAAEIERDEDPKVETKKVSGSHSIAEIKSKRLFGALQELMEKEGWFRNPLLTREEVMEQLKTNSTYLAQVIKDNAGMNYSQYVNSFRIREALKALSDKERIEVPIKDIAVEAGFNSLTTFYKLFQQATGISPSAYRRSLLTIE